MPEISEIEETIHINLASQIDHAHQNTVLYNRLNK
jgi:hypothetical protein